MSYEIFVTNVPRQEEQLSHQEFLRMFQNCGPILRYSIRRPLRTAVIVYGDEESMQKALQLNATYQDSKGYYMYVSKRVTYSFQQLYLLLKQQKWEQVYEKIQLFPIQEITQSAKLMHEFAHFYELIACQHFDLFEYINELIEHPFFDDHETYDIGLYNEISLLQVRKEGWYMRKEKIQRWLIESTKLSDDIIKHILIDYMF